MNRKVILENKPGRPIHNVTHKRSLGNEKSFAASTSMYDFGSERYVGQTVLLHAVASRWKKCRREVRPGILFTHIWHQLRTLPTYEIIDLPDLQDLGLYPRDHFQHKMRTSHPELARPCPLLRRSSLQSKQESCQKNKSSLIELPCPQPIPSAR